MTTIVLKTAKRNTSVSRLAVRQAVTEAYGKNGSAKTSSKTVRKSFSKRDTKH